MWHGLLVDIPNGWALCDGTNGTPDLREKFVRGAANGIDPGGIGGALTHNHTGVAQNDTHNHVASSSLESVPFADTTEDQSDSLVTGEELWDAEGDGEFDTDTEGHGHEFSGETEEHQHAIPVNTDAHGHVLTVNAKNHLPPYYDIAYIMKT